MAALQHDFLDLPSTDVMELHGRLDSDNALDIEEQGLLRIQSGARELVMDLGGVTYLTGAAVQSLLRLAREMQDRGGKLVACNLSPAARDMFDACGLDSMIRCYNDRDMAQMALAA